MSRAATDGELAISGLGLVSPVGLTAASSSAALRAGIVRITEYPAYRCLPPEGDDAPEGDPGGEPLRAGVVPGLDPDLPGAERLLRLGLTALQRLFAETGLGRREMARGALLVALPLPDAVVSAWELGQRFAREMGARSGVRDWALVESVEAGPAGAFRLIDRARALAASGEADFCVLLTVDTFLDHARLSRLDEGWRIKSSRNVDGLIPGEAGAALLLEPRERAARRNARPLAVVGQLAFGNEPSGVRSERWSEGVGLMDALRPLVAGGAGRWVLCNLNGESYGAREWGLLRTRLAEELASVDVVTHPAHCIGDAGTAMAGVLVAYASQAFARGFAPAPSALLWVASDDGGRAALVLHAP